ncbi:MAG: rRNA maturation RNase YbeY [Rickettsiales bacterium]|jgi:probable rRNA maturation factor|nr:rRNA maturation RNase YbeY [Rickettsiales bacterium]
MMHFIYADERWDAAFESIALRVADVLRTRGEISILLANDEAIRRYNREWRGIDAPTNVLSFATGDDELPGDIILSIDTLRREAEDEGISLEAHFAHMVCHGLLHLDGYDHIDDKDAEEMEAREAEALAAAGYAL